jgi:hypothetical protein
VADLVKDRLAARQDLKELEAILHREIKELETLSVLSVPRPWSFSGGCEFLI